MRSCSAYDVADGIEAEHRDARRGPAVRRPSTHSIVVVLPAPLGPIEPKISPSLDVERDVVDGDRPAVRLAGCRKRG